MKSPTMTTTPSKEGQTATAAAADTLTITDNRTGRQYDIPIKEGSIRATDLRQIKAAPKIAD